MIRYQVTMQHNEKTLQALAHMQYDLFCKKNQMTRALISFVALAVGILNFSKWWGALLLVYGAYMSSSKYAQANHTAKKMTRGIENAGLSFPTTQYLFRENAVEIIALPEKEKLVDLQYEAIFSLGEDAQHFYLFRDEYGGYVVPKAELGKPFPQEEELRTKSARLAELDARLNLDRPAAQAEKKKPEQER